MARRINAPGIEVNEVDRSQYEETVDNSTVGTATLVLGFADKGDDYSVRWINTLNTFQRTYGTPQTEAERYFYNTVAEVLDGGGTCYAAKLPYYNDSLDRFVYTSFSVSPSAQYLLTKDSVLNQELVTFKPPFGQPVSASIRDMVFFPHRVRTYEDSVINPQNNKAFKDKTFHVKAMDDLFQHVSDRLNLKERYSDLSDIDMTALLKVFGQLFTFDREFDVDWLARNMMIAEVIDEVLGFDGTEADITSHGKAFLVTERWNHYCQDANPQRYIGYVQRIQNALRDEFGRDATADGIVAEFEKDMTVDDYVAYYNDLVSVVGSMNIYGLKISLPDWFDESRKYVDMTDLDDSLTSYATVVPDANPSSDETMTYDFYDRLLVKETRVPLNKVYVVDKTRGKYGQDEFGNEVVGIVPVLVSPANALFYQEQIQKRDGLLGVYNVVSKVRNSYRKGSGDVFSEAVDAFDQQDTQVTSRKDGTTVQFVGLGDYLGSEDVVTVNDYTVSQNAAEHFPTLRFVNGRLDRQYLGQIGLVVYRMYRDAANDGKLSFQAVEAFVGSLDRFATDTQTGRRTFIDDVVNGGSDYVSLFSNANIGEGKDTDPIGLKNASTWVVSNQVACSMGFYGRDTRKNIHVSESILNAVQKVFDRSEDRNTLDIDIMVDGGVSNIAQFIASTQRFVRDPDTDKTTDEEVWNQVQRYGKYDLDDEASGLFKLESQSDCAVWRRVIQKFDEFCKSVRKDCMFIADCPRPFCLEGNQKVVRRTRPGNTVRKTILPKVKAIAGAINSSYSAGYLAWTWSLDRSSGSYMWLPPSVKALGAYLYTDNAGAFWDAPAGLSRGRMSNTLDIAFNPTNDEAGTLYQNSWNYAVSYPLDGVVLEGQRTFQRDKTALDRVNVRRLMLGLEKNVRNFCKYYVYEGNTQFNRQRLTDAIDRYLGQVRANDGISQYVVVCDERNNSSDTVDNNELHVAVAVRPVKAIEFIVLSFIATNQSVDVQEAISSELGA